MAPGCGPGTRDSRVSTGFGSDSSPCREDNQTTENYRVENLALLDERSEVIGELGIRIRSGAA